MRENRKKHADQAVFPVKLRILPDMVFNKRAPIVMGVHVEAGLLREGTPICVPSKNNILLGRVSSIEINHKTVPEARTGQEVSVRIDPIEGEAPKAFGRHFDHTDLLISMVRPGCSGLEIRGVMLLSVVQICPMSIKIIGSDNRDMDAHY